MTKKYILLVEDNPDDEALALRALKRNNLTQDVVVARDGVEALDYLTGAATLPTVILLDLKLPRKDGLEVLREIRQNSRTRLVPVVILTSSNEQADMLNGYTLGANGYIRKPVDFVEFRDTVYQFGVYWLTINEPPPN
jgi:CheY-like chemotaxis protein